MPTGSRRKASPSANKRKLTVLRALNLQDLPWLVHGFSTRLGGYSRLYGGGALNLGFTRHDTPAAVKRNRQAWLSELGVNTGSAASWPLVTLRQIHSATIHPVRGVPERPAVGDGLLTATPGLLLAVQTADCLPLLLVDTRRHAVAALHAGWRGTLARLAEKGVGEMRRLFGSSPGELRAAIGPGIHVCCYEVGQEVREQFESQFPYAAELFREVPAVDPVREKYPLLFLNVRPPGHGETLRRLYLDLVEANRRQLLDAGVAATNITASPFCTSCRADLLFSYRADQGATGRLMGVVGMRP